jgi:branched-chain amino acid transport system substrate-binding protein
MTSGRLRRVLTALALLALAATATATGPVSAQPKPIIIEAILSITGSAASIGADEAAGLSAFEKLANKTGGIHGVPIQFHVQDDQSQPAVAVQLFGQLLPSKPTVVLGSSIAAQSQAMAALVKDGPVLYAITPNFMPPPHGYVFATGSPSHDLTAAGVTYYRAKGLTKVGVIVTTDASGQNNFESLEYALALPENKTMKLVDKETFAIGDVSIAAQMSRLKASGAQVVFSLPNGTAFGTSLHGLADAGLDLPVYTSAANFSPILLERFKTFLPKELTCAGASWFNRERRANDPLKKPIEDFYTTLAADGVTSPTVGHAFAWDPALIVVTALRKLPAGANATQLRDEIEKMRKFPGVQGMYDFSTGDQHGANENGILVLRNDPEHPGKTTVVSKQGGLPL